MQTSHNKAILYYDGDCPMCHSFQKSLQIQKKIPLECRNARSFDMTLRTLQGHGYDINQGIFLMFKGKIYQGTEALTRIDRYGKDDQKSLRNSRSGQKLYTMLKFFRKFLLCLWMRNGRIEHKEAGHIIKE